MSLIKTTMPHNKTGKNNIKETRRVGVVVKRVAWKTLKFIISMDSLCIKVNSRRRAIITAQSVGQTVPGTSAMILASTNYVMVLKKRIQNKLTCFSTERVFLIL